MTKIKDFVKRVYCTPVDLTGEDYTNGQSKFILEAISGTSVARLSQGAFIAGFATMIGMPPGLIGMLSAIPMLAHFFQIFGGIYYGNKTQYKLQLTVLNIIIRSLIGTIYFIPLFISQGISQNISLVVVYCITSFAMSFINPPIINWIMDLSPESIRGEYFARREMYTMIVMAISELILAQMLDLFKLRGAEALGFNVLGLIIIVWAITNTYAFSAVKEPIRPKKAEKMRVKKDLRLLSKNYDFKKLSLLYVFWNFSYNIGALYVNIYMIGSLGRSYLYIMVMSMLTLGFRVLSVKAWGRFVQSHTWSKGIELGIVLAGIAMSTLLFANSATAWIVLPIYHILVGIAWGSLGITFFNLQVMFSPDESRTLYIGTLAAISGISGFVATVSSGLFIDNLAHLYIGIKNFTVGNIQMVFLVSGILTILTGIYVRRVITPMEVAKNS